MTESTEYRIEHDTMGEVRVPAAKAGWFMAGRMMIRPDT